MIPPLFNFFTTSVRAGFLDKIETFKKSERFTKIAKFFETIRNFFTGLTSKTGLIGRISKFFAGVGKILKPYDLVAGSDYFILPSRWEGLPNCVLESLALGTPVISTKQIFALNDFKKNISNKSIMLFESINEISKKINFLEKRKDYRKPKLRKSLLKNYISPISFNKKINKIILKIT